MRTSALSLIDSVHSASPASSAKVLPVAPGAGGAASSWPGRRVIRNLMVFSAPSASSFLWLAEGDGGPCPFWIGDWAPAPGASDTAISAHGPTAASQACALRFIVWVLVADRCRASGDRGASRSSSHIVPDRNKTRTCHSGACISGPDWRELLSGRPRGPRRAYRWRSASDNAPQ